MSYEIQFLVILALTFFGCIKVSTQGRAGRKYLRNLSDNVLFNAEAFCVIALVLFLLFPQGRIAPQGWWLLIATAVLTVVYQVCYVTALREGPVSLTVLIVNFSILLITLYGMIAYRERLYLTQLIGIAFLLLSMFLSLKRGEGERSVTARWLLIVIAAMLGTTVGTILMKTYVKTWGESYPHSENTFTALFYALSAVLSVGLYFLLSRTGKRQRATHPPLHKGLLLHVLVVGVALGIYQRFYILGMAHLDTAFMFPTYAGMQSTAMALIGIFCFRDRLSVRQLIGVCAGIVSVVLMNLRVFELF